MMSYSIVSLLDSRRITCTTAFIIIIATLHSHDNFLMIRSTFSPTSSSAAVAVVSAMSTTTSMRQGSNTIVRRPSLRQRLLNGEKSYGPMILSDSPVVAEIFGYMGYGHIIVDHEHGPTDIRSGQQLLRAIDCAASSYNRTESIVRLPSANDPAYMKKVLDSLRLPGGVLVPMVDSVDMARKVVQSTRYPYQKSYQQQQQQDHPDGDDDDNNNNHSNPNSDEGIRGCAVPFIRSNQYGITNSVHDYLQYCNDDLLVMVQIETMAGINCIDEIAALDGIDGIFLGPFDLSASIGKMGQFQDPPVQEMIAHAEQAVVRNSQKNHCFLAGFKPPNRDLQTMFHTDGYSLICGSVDIGMLRDAALRDVQNGIHAMKKQ